MRGGSGGGRVKTAADVVEQLRPRRECLQGALQDVEALERAVANLESGQATVESFASWTRMIFGQRKELLDLAARQFDDALDGYQLDPRDLSPAISEKSARAREDA